MKKNPKTKLIALVLTLALMITGISIGDTVTANAAVKATEFANNGSITMKPGDVTKVFIAIKDGSEFVEKHKWISSDTSVLTVGKDYDYDAESWFIELTAVKLGTAEFGIPNSPTMRMTVTVKAAKMTAKQKKCKHTYKVTKKATCQREGIKTCRKCKYQKTIAKTAHKYKKTYVESINYEYLRTWLLCRTCESSGTDTWFWTENVPYYDGMQLTGDRVDPIYHQKHEEMFERFEQHCREAHSDDGAMGNNAMGCWTAGDKFYNPTKVTKTVMKCQYCHKEK